jgi:hypothetical protein
MICCCPRLARFWPLVAGIMHNVRNVVLAVVLCFVGALASANSVDTIPITGTAADGFAQTAGDFSIHGPGLFLYQGLPDGPNQIGTCTVGAVCTLSFSPLNSAAFCGGCTYYSGGSFGSNIADYLDPHLTFTGSAFYSGGSTLQMPFIVSGTITGYELVNCFSGTSGCTLGPKEFTVRIFGSGTETLTVYSNFSGPQVPVYGANATFSGFATVETVPEPTSLVLTGSGLVWVWIKWKVRNRFPLERAISSTSPDAG